MSLKSIEMQIALPRTVDSAKISEQLQQRAQNMIDHASREMQVKEEQNRQSVVKMEHNEELHLNSDDSNESHPHDQQRRKHKQQKKVVNNNHPYKGKSIDYSG